MGLIQSFCMNESNKTYVLNQKKNPTKKTKKEMHRFLKNLLLC